MEDLLESWEVSQDTIKAFRDNNIDITCLDCIEEEELKILIPEGKLRDRIKFKQGLKKYREEIETVHSNTDSLDTDVADSLSLSSCELFTSDKSDQSKLNLQQILAQNMRGRQAIQAIQKKKFDSSSRNNLVHAVVDYYLKTFQKMTKVDFDAIATEIVRLCPTECKETYVPSRTIGHKNTMPAKGKLVDRYYNQTRMLRKSGMLPQKRKLSSSSCADYSESDSEITEESHVNDEPWLKFNRDPWPLVEEKWTKTCEYRKKKTYSTNAVLTTMLNEWPCLKASNGHRLIDIDFNYLYPEKSLKLFEKWDNFQKIASKLIEDDVQVKPELKTLLTTNDADENTRDFALCSSLPYKMKPTSKIPTTDKKKIY